MKKIPYQSLSTEQANARSRGLDALTAAAAVAVMNREDARVARAVGRESKNIARGVTLIAAALKSGGRIFFFGAGTSGRLGVLESVELPPTFGTPPSLAQAVMAGGRRAVFKSKEGAEDDGGAARSAVRLKVRRGDIVIGIAASGVTPFARAAILEGRRRGAKTILVTCNKIGVGKTAADVLIAPRVGPEIIAGSTRLKSGTATKMVLNMLTTLAMVQWGKVYGNRMVDLKPTSRKLRERSLRLVREFTGLSRAAAKKHLRAAGGHVKTAILMQRKNIGRADARRRLTDSNGFLRMALK